MPALQRPCAWPPSPNNLTRGPFPLDRTYLVGLAAAPSGLSLFGLRRTDSSEWSARGFLPYRGKAARAPAEGGHWWSLEEGWAGARAGVGLGRRREGSRKGRPRLVPHRSKTRLESPWPCRMVPVGGCGGGVLRAKRGRVSIMACIGETMMTRRSEASKQ